MNLHYLAAVIFNKTISEEDNLCGDVATPWKECPAGVQESYQGLLCFQI